MQPDLVLALNNFGRKSRPVHRFLTNPPVANHLKTNLRLLFRLNGMEEVAGSIPARSTKTPNDFASILTGLYLPTAKSLWARLRFCRRSGSGRESCR